MKYGIADYGMNVYEGGLFDLEERLANLKQLGYSGIERLEAADTCEAVNRAVTFHRAGMDFATCRGPRLEQNMEWSCAFGKDYICLTPGDCGRDVEMDTFIRRSRNFCRACAKYGISAALHNHLGSRIENQEELDFFLKEVPEAKLLLDIGHLAAAGGDVCATAGRYFDRLAAIHFKDVFVKDESIGLDRWWERLRFCELGGGNRPGMIDWQGTARLLKEKNYRKWVFVEHDTHLREPLEDLKISITELKAIME